VTIWRNFARASPLVRCWLCAALFGSGDEEVMMHGLIYVIGLIVVVLFILSFLGLR
jgi:hypothetical protein